MQLQQLICGLTPLRVEGSLQREVTGVTYDSRRVFPGMVFVAVPGHRRDGHEFISAAIDRGACAVIAERNGFSSRRATQIKVVDSRVALARAAAEYHGHPSRRLRVVGVTGTNGKTVVSFLVRHLLEAAGTRCGLLGTVRYEVGDRSLPAQRTTPEAVEIQKMLAQMVTARCAACVLEVSSHALDQHRVEGVAFDVGIFTNLTEDHLDYHGSVEEYYAAKRRLFALLQEGGKPARAVINIDDPFGARLHGETGAAVRISFGFTESATIRASRIRLGAEGTTMRVETPAGAIDCRLPLLGRLNVYNALAAIGTGIVLGLPLDLIRSALQSVPQVPGRLERIDAGQRFGVYVDYAHTADALHHVLEALREITTGRLILVFGCGGDRDPRKRAPMGRVAGEQADWALVTSDNPRHESPEEIAAQVVAGLRSARRGIWKVVLDRWRAIDEALRAARPGDAVLIAGKGHETYQEFADTVVPFDDRWHARETLEALGYVSPKRRRE